MPDIPHWSKTHTRHKPEIKLVVYPGEKKRLDGKAIGAIYVVGGKEGDKYPMMGGPPPGKGYKDDSGHTADATPAGEYILGQAEHHITKNWTKSVIPWGARLREHEGEVQYEVDGAWIN